MLQSSRAHGLTEASAGSGRRRAFVSALAALAVLAVPGGALAAHQGPDPEGPPQPGAKFMASMFDNPSFGFKIGSDGATVVDGVVKFKCKKGSGKVSVRVLAIGPETETTYAYFGHVWTTKTKLKKGRKTTRLKVKVDLYGYFTSSSFAQGTLKVTGKGCKASTKRWDSSSWLQL